MRKIGHNSAQDGILWATSKERISAPHLDDIEIGGTGAADVDGDRINEGGLSEGLDLHGHCGAEHQCLALRLEVGQHLHIRRRDLVRKLALLHVCQLGCIHFL